MGLNAPQTTSSILTPAQKRNSVDISSSISRMQLSKTTYMWVCSKLCEGNKTCFLPYVPSFHILSFSNLGRFIHAILQPVLSTHKSGSSLNDEINSVAENNETRFVFQTFEENVVCLCCCHFV